MGVFDNFANRFRGDDYDEDEDLDEYEDEEEDESPRRGGFGVRKKQSDYEDEDEYEEQPKGRTSLTGNSARSRNTRSGAQDLPAQRTGRGTAPAQAGGRMQVRIIKPSSFDQARQITDTLLAHRTVLLNLEGLDINTAQRIVDFASGSCYALRGNFMKISQYIIVITPEDVDIAGDVAAAGGQQEAAAAAAFMGAAAASAQGMSGGMQNPQSSDSSNPFRGSGMGSMMGGMY